MFDVKIIIFIINVIVIDNWGWFEISWWCFVIISIKLRYMYCCELNVKWIICISDSYLIIVFILIYLKCYCRILKGCIILKYGNIIYIFWMFKNKIEKFKLYNK